MSKDEDAMKQIFTEKDISEYISEWIDKQLTDTTKEELMKNIPRLYHITPTIRADVIEREGLKPQCKPEKKITQCDMGIFGDFDEDHVHEYADIVSSVTGENEYTVFSFNIIDALFRCYAEVDTSWGPSSVHLKGCEIPPEALRREGDYIW